MRTIHRWALCGLCLALAACDAPPADPAASDAPAPVDPSLGIEPEPFLVFDFEVAGQIDGRWVGRLGDGGSVAVEMLSAEQMGATWGLVQTWTFVTPPDDGMPATTATFFGIVNLASGELVLNGATADGGIVRVRGHAEVAEGGAISIGGDVMFNPQPEPPGHF